MTARRMLLLVSAFIVAWGVYSYGMFHSVVPTRTDFLAVAHCAGGIPVIPNTAGSDAAYCLDPSGQWKLVQTSNGPFFLALAIAWGSTLLATHGAGWAKKLFASLSGNVILGSTLFGIPFGLWSLQTNFVEGTLTPTWALRVMLYSGLGGAFFGVVMWYTTFFWLTQRNSK